MKVNRYALNDFMEGEGLRLTDLHEKSGVSISFLSELRSGTKVEASAAVVKKIADALGVRPRSIASSSDSDEDDELDEPTPRTAIRGASKPATASDAKKPKAATR